VAGRSRRRWPRLRVPHWSARWRRVGLAALVLALVTLGGWWVYQSPLLSIREVTVEGSDALSPQVVRSTADLEGRSILRPDFSGARQRLLALPMVKEVQIGRDWPTGVRITVVERAPWGVWEAGGQRFVIDDEGVVLDMPAPEGAPVIVQLDAPAPLAPGDRVDPGALAVARELVPTAERTLGRRVIALEFSRASGLTAVLAGGPDRPALRATFGDGQGYEFKVATLYALLRRADEEGRTLRRVDLRFGDRVAVQ
jgi:cell division protein FtsQ